MVTIQFQGLQIALNADSNIVIIQEDAGLYSGLVSGIPSPESTYAADTVSYISSSTGCTTIALQTPASVLSA